MYLRNLKKKWQINIEKLTLTGYNCSWSQIYIPYARDGRPLFSYNRSRFVTAFMEVKRLYFTIYNQKDKK